MKQFLTTVMVDLLLMSGCSKQSKPAASAGPGSGFILIAL